MTRKDFTDIFQFVCSYFSITNLLKWSSIYHLDSLCTDMQQSFRHPLATKGLLKPRWPSRVSSAQAFTSKHHLLKRIVTHCGLCCHDFFTSSVSWSLTSPGYDFNHLEQGTRIQTFCQTGYGRRLRWGLVRSGAQ